MKHRLSLVLFVGLTCFAFSAQGQEKKDDKKAIQGTWNAKKGDQAVVLTIDEKKFTLELGGKSIEGTYTLDSSKTPKHLDLTITGGTEAGAMKFAGKTSKAIYELDGDRMKWHAPEPGNEERPAAFPNDGEKIPKTLTLNFDREKK